jgi:hypothetical protein
MEMIRHKLAAFESAVAGEEKEALGELLLSMAGMANRGRISPACLFPSFW